MPAVNVPFEVPQVFQPLWQPAWYKGAYGGRGSGKSWAFALLGITRCFEEGVRGACIREVQKLLSHSSKRLLEDMISRVGLSNDFRCGYWDIKTPSGGEITFHGMSDYNAANIKSLEGVDWVWIEEAQTLSTLSWELLRPTIRKEGAEIWASWNPRNPSDPIDKFFRGPSPVDNAVLVESQYTDNPFFSKRLEAERRLDKEQNPDRYAHIWLGDYEPQVSGALWRRDIFHEWRIREMRAIRGRTVVAVDPAVSHSETSDEHGIVVCALGEDGRGYVLEDASLRGMPNQWAMRAVAVYDKWDADAIVIEKNQGGDMCRHTLETIRRNVRILEVHASRGKHIRAEPISALYNLGKVSHVGTFPELETQLTQFTASGYVGQKSPDRAEAMIWGLSNLFPKLTEDRRPNNEPAQYSFYRPPSSNWMSR